MICFSFSVEKAHIQSPLLLLSKNPSHYKIHPMRKALLALLTISSIAALRADDVKEIVLKPSPDAATALAYDTKTLTVKAGSKVKLTFDNSKSAVPQPHNVVICKVGTKDKVLGAAMTMLSDPNGMAKSYIPESTDILQKMNFVQPGQTNSIEFVAPAEAGDYPYLCTFPGHGMLMNGILKVEP
jgi:azurin